MTILSKLQWVTMNKSHLLDPCDPCYKKKVSFFFFPPENDYISTYKFPSGTSYPEGQEYSVRCSEKPTASPSFSWGSHEFIRTSRTEFGQQMRSGDLPAYLSLNRFLNGIFTGSPCYFVRIQLIFRKFNSCVTDGPTDGRTDGRTDTPSYIDAITHLKIFCLMWIFFFFLFSLFCAARVCRLCCVVSMRFRISMSISKCQSVCRSPKNG